MFIGMAPGIQAGAAGTLRAASNYAMQSSASERQPKHVPMTSVQFVVIAG
jgi:hypothetical protein